MSTKKATREKGRFTAGGFLTLAAALLLLLGAIIPVAYAELERVGPVSAANGYPAWYQDKTGLALEFCSPMNASELDGGWCLLLNGDTTVPEVFPTPFADEHFWWAGDASIDFPTADPKKPGKAKLVLGLEGAFAVGPVVAGDQVVFGRVRVDIRDLPFDGLYTVYTPYTTWIFDYSVADGKIFFTEDIGITCPPGQFDCALASHIGPFLLPSATPGGAEMAPLTATNLTPDTDPAHFGGAFTPTAYPGTGKSYIADPARLGPVTGSPIGQNYFRIVGPNGFDIQTDNFALMGRIMTGPIASRITVDRASYAQTASMRKLDVFATGLPTTQGRLPGNLPPTPTLPSLSFFDAPCGVNQTTNALIPPVGALETQMFAADTAYWGQTKPAEIPVEVCVKDATARDATGQTVPAYFRGIVTDEVSITEAAYAPGNGGSLSVKATSSDEVNPTVLSLVGFGPLTNGQIVVSPLAAPRSRVRVLSSSGLGMNDAQVTTGLATGANQSVPVAVNDTASTNEDTSATIDVLANDTVSGAPIQAGAGTAAIAVAPQLGTGVVNADGTIGYTPNPNTVGADSFTYTVTVNGQTSNTATVQITINPVNDAPVAVDDATQAVLNVPATINLLTNDTDPDGLADLANVQIVTQPAAGATVTAGAGGSVTFNATVAGVYTFTYQAVDQAGTPSANTATVTVTVGASEAIQNMTATYRLTQARWIVTGTDTIPAGQTVTITYLNGTQSGMVIGTAVVGATGTWLLDLRPATGLFNPRNVGATLVRATSSLGGATAQVGIVIRN